MTDKRWNILIACEESQTVCIEMRKRGHNTFSCDVQESSGGHPEWHIQGDALEALNSREWDLVIAHPPCTYLSKASACRLYPKAGEIDQARYQKGVEAKEFFLEFLNTDHAVRVAVENPVSLKIFEMPPFSQEVEPYYFGHPVSKKTRLWLRGLPHLVPTNLVEKQGTYLPSSTSRNRYSGKNDKLTRDARVASKTFHGLAKAMAEQWTPFINY